MPETRLVGRLARHQGMMQRVWILGCFSGVGVVAQSRQLLDNVTCMLWTRCSTVRLETAA